MAEELTDEFVANALAKEARDNNIRYSAMGLDAFLPKRPPTNHPRTNTRFLRNIIKETESHNAALLAKEAQESKARLRDFSTKQRGGDIRQRQLGDIAAILGNSSTKRRRLNEKDIDSDAGRREGSRRHTSRGEEDHRHGGHRSKSPRRRTDDYDREARTYRDDERHRRKSKYANNDEDSDREHSKGLEKRRREEEEVGGRSKSGRSHRRRSRSRSPERRHRRRRRSRSPTLSGSEEEESGRLHDSRTKAYEYSNKKRKYRQASRSPSVSDTGVDSKRRRRSGADRKHSIESPPPLTKKLDEARRRQNSKSKVTTKPSEPESESDPLDEILGPRPRPKSPVISRGRGKISAASGIDSRFSANYDPTADVELDIDEENDWEQALEALRDRQKWKQTQGERLKSAGFTDEQIKQWESGGEKREEDVKWAKNGEGREWDRGKYITEDGQVVTSADWGRLK